MFTSDITPQIEVTVYHLVHCGRPPTRHAAHTNPRGTHSSHTGAPEGITKPKQPTRRRNFREKQYLVLEIAGKVIMTLIRQLLKAMAIVRHTGQC